VQTDLGSYIGWKYHEAGLQHRVHQILMDSRHWDTSLYSDDFFHSILIDGGHKAAIVESDTNKALRLLRSGGLMLWHDFCPADSALRDLAACRGVILAIHSIWRRWAPEFRRIFWIRHSFLLVGVKR
jgi:hypothetical protein